MENLKTQYITYANGKKISVILPIKKYLSIIEELEDQEDVKLYDEAKKNDDGKRLSMKEYLKNRKNKSAEI